MIDLRRADSDRPQLVNGLLIGLATIVGLMVLVVLTGWSQDLDNSVALWAYDTSHGHLLWLRFLEVAAVVFSNWSIAGLFAIMAIIAWRTRERNITVWLVVATATTLLGNVVLKLIFRRDRPFWDEALHEIGGYSFPSGHSIGAGLAATVAILLTIVLTGRGLKRRALITLWVALGVFIAASRVFLGVHYLTDVVAGASLGAFVTLLAWRLLVSGNTRLPSELAVLTGSGARKAAVIINPVKVGNIDDFKAKVVQVAALHDWSEPMWFETTVEDPGHGQTDAAIAAGVDLIIAAGGDGTVRAVCERAASSGVAVGVLPHGTGNLLARNLDIPVNTRDALDIVFGGQDRAIDLANFKQKTTTSNDDGELIEESSETAFLVMAGLGMDAMIMSGVNEDLKKRVGYLAYFVSGVKAITFPRTKVWITVDDAEPVMFKARTVVVGNVGFLQGGIPLIPLAEIDDGQLDVVIVAPKRFLGWLSIVARVILRRQTDDKRLARLCGRSVHVRAEKPVPMQLDGDPVGDGIEITATVKPGVVLVRVPVSPLKD